MTDPSAVGLPVGAWWMCCMVGVRPPNVMPPVMALVVGSTMTPPTPVALVATGGFCRAPVRTVDRTTVWVVCAPQVIDTFVTFTAPIVPVPLATVHAWLGAAIW